MSQRGGYILGYWDSWTCSDCAWLDPDDKKWGDMYCTKRGWYVDPGSSSCDKFRANRIEVLNGLKLFKDMFTVFNADAYSFMQPYEGVEEILSQCLSEDSQQDNTLSNIINNFAKPALDFIKSSNFENFIMTYKNMLDNLIKKYNLNLEDLGLSTVMQKSF